MQLDIWIFTCGKRASLGTPGSAKPAAGRIKKSIFYLTYILPAKGPIRLLFPTWIRLEFLVDKDEANRLAFRQPFVSD